MPLGLFDRAARTPRYTKRPQVFEDGSVTYNWLYGSHNINWLQARRRSRSLATATSGRFLAGDATIKDPYKCTAPEEEGGVAPGKLSLSVPVFALPPKAAAAAAHDGKSEDNSGHRAADQDKPQQTAAGVVGGSADAAAGTAAKSHQQEASAAPPSTSTAASGISDSSSGGIRRPVLFYDNGAKREVFLSYHSDRMPADLIMGLPKVWFLPSEDTSAVQVTAPGAAAGGVNILRRGLICRQFLNVENWQLFWLHEHAKLLDEVEEMVKFLLERTRKDLQAPPPAKRLPPQPKTQPLLAGARQTSG